MENNNIVSEITVSYDNDFISRLYKVTPAQDKLLGQISMEMQGRISKSLILKIEKLSKENPNLPQLKNFVTVAYYKLGDLAKSIEVNNELIEEFPDYLFGKLNAANNFIHVGKPEMVLELLGKNLDLKTSFPSRSEFHFSEVQAYYFTTIYYAIATKNLPLAENRLQFYKSIDEDDLRIEELEESVEDLKLLLQFENQKSEYDDFPEFIQNSPPVTNRVDAPVFHHPEIHQLYQLGFENAMPVLEVVLALPRVTLIQDLELVLQDGIERYPYFSDKEWSVATHSFPLHALFLLMELKATESITLVLDFLQYEEGFLEQYIGDSLTQDVWQCVYFLGKEKPSLLKDFLLKPGIYSFAKSAVSQALIQISILDPHRAIEIEQLCIEVFDFFINAKIEDNVIDPTFLGLLIGDVADAQFKSLFGLVKKLYDLDYIDKSIEGDYEYFMNNHQETNACFSEYKLKTLTEIYSSYDFYEESESESDFFESTASQPKVVQMPVNRVKVNRNDPCPCGSGKKYKKCCG